MAILDRHLNKIISPFRNEVKKRRARSQLQCTLSKKKKKKVVDQVYCINIVVQMLIPYNGNIRINRKGDQIEVIVVE